MSKLPIFEHFLSVRNLKPKLKWFFKPKLFLSIELGPCIIAVHGLRLVHGEALLQGVERWDQGSWGPGTMSLQGPRLLLEPYIQTRPLWVELLVKQCQCQNLCLGNLSLVE